MTIPTPPHRQGHQPRTRVPAPDDVTDRLLWINATDVAAAHHPGPDGTCTNLQCRGQRAPCAAARAAHRATQFARAATSAPPVNEPHPARGRVPVPSGPSGFAGLAPGAATPPVRPTPKSTFAAFRRPGVRAADSHDSEVHP